jgi:Flp pilus assembly protein TadG
MGVTKPLSGRTRESPRTCGVWHDQRGASAVEFALVVPAIILMYIGAAELGNLLTADRRVETVASTAADLTAQVKKVSNADLADIVAASTSILTPYNTTPLKVVLSSVVADKDNVTKVDWSYSSSGSGRAVGSPYTLPTGTTVAYSSVIVAEVTYAFKPMLDPCASVETQTTADPCFSPGAFNLKRTFYARPRRSLTVAKN